MSLIGILLALFIVPAGCDDGSEMLEDSDVDLAEPTTAQYMAMPSRLQRQAKRTHIYIPDPYRNGEPPPTPDVWDSRIDRAVHEGNNEFFAWQQARTLFELKHPTVEVNFFFFDMWDADAQALLNTSMHSEENSPAFYVARNLPDSIINGWMADITEYLDDWPAARDHRLTQYGGKFGDRVYCVPAAEEQWPVVQYRKDFFADAGIFNEFGEPGPRSDWTWADFREYCRKLTVDKDGDGRTDRWGFVSRHGAFDQLYLTCHAIGQRLFIPDKTGEFTWKFNGDDPALRHAIETARAMYLEDKSVRAGVDFQWGNAIEEFKAERAAMSAVTTSHPPADYTEQPDQFGSHVKTKDVLGMVPYPTDENHCRYPVVTSNMYGFNPTYSPQQLEAAIDWYREWVCGYTNRLYMMNLQRKNALMDRPDPFLRYYLISPYRSEVPLATLPRDDYYPKEYYRTYTVYREAPLFPRPRDFGLREPEGFADSINILFSEALFAGPNTDIDAMIARHTRIIHKNCMKFKVDDDVPKLRAYYEAVQRFADDHLPADTAEDWKTFIETKCQCW